MANSKNYSVWDRLQAFANPKPTPQQVTINQQQAAARSPAQESTSGLVIPMAGDSSLADLLMQQEQLSNQAIEEQSAGLSKMQEQADKLSSIAEERSNSNIAPFLGIAENLDPWAHSGLVESYQAPLSPEKLQELKLNLQNMIQKGKQNLTSERLQSLRDRLRAATGGFVSPTALANLKLRREEAEFRKDRAKKEDASKFLESKTKERLSARKSFDDALSFYEKKIADSGGITAFGKDAAFMDAFKVRLSDMYKNTEDYGALQEAEIRRINSMIPGISPNLFKPGGWAEVLDYARKGQTAGVLNALAALKLANRMLQKQQLSEARKLRPDLEDLYKSYELDNTGLTEEKPMSREELEDLKREAESLRKLKEQE